MVNVVVIEDVGVFLVFTVVVVRDPLKCVEIFVILRKVWPTVCSSVSDVVTGAAGAGGAGAGAGVIMKIKIHKNNYKR